MAATSHILRHVHAKTVEELISNLFTVHQLCQVQSNKSKETQPSDKSLTGQSSARNPEISEIKIKETSVHYE
jgi:hypothetical protein